MMKNGVTALVVIPLFVSPCCAHSQEVIADSLKHVHRDGVSLNEVVIRGNTDRQIQMLSPLSTLRANKQFIEQHFSGSLMQTLSVLPGVKAMSIGAGQSKPVIRGLGFNRVLVTENGVAHQGQQWGDDHGLEVDQYAIDRADVLKGPAALAYGSDAIAGVISLKSDMVPFTHCSGVARAFWRSNNQSIGSSVQLGGRKGSFVYKASATWINYADYHVPTDSIAYYSYYIKLHNRCLRNTAGRELDGRLFVGYDGKKWRTMFGLSSVNTCSGFFANAHGLEVRLSRIDYDSSRRDIDLPYHRVSHTMLTNHTALNWPGGFAEADVAFQANMQREYSEPVSHGYMPVPSSTLERSFDKYTLSANVKACQTFGSHELQVGLSTSYQHNRRGGWGFVIPDFEQSAVGAYLLDKWQMNDRLKLTAGARFDYGTMRIHSYSDWYKTPVATGDSVYITRSSDMHRCFNSVIWSVGANYLLNDWTLKFNVGKSFRMPIARELGADGLNYSIFRYEKGNISLSPEQSYQLDTEVAYRHGAWSFQVTPYINYFPNYIYLNPTSTYKEGLQLYSYTQARVLRWGIEAGGVWQVLPSLSITAEGEYLHAQQLSGSKRGYSLPYSTPWSVRAEVRYILSKSNADNNDYVAIEWQVVGTQTRIVPPEEVTKGHQLLNASLGKEWVLGKNKIDLVVRGENLFDKRYYDHTSYYRLIGVPEPGRNLSVMLSYKF